MSLRRMVLLGLGAALVLYRKQRLDAADRAFPAATTRP